MDFGVNKMPIEVIRESTFVGTSFRDIYSGINGKGWRKSWNEFNHLKDIDQKYYCWNYYDVSVNKYGVKCGTSLRFWENKGWINEIDPYGWFHWYFRYWLGRRLQDDERQINWWEKNIARFRGKLVKIIKCAVSKFDDDSVSPETRQIVLYWGYELTEKDFLINSTN